MIKKIEKYIDKHKLIEKKGNVLVAISGGADSVALLHILRHLDYNCHAIHCNFHLRNEESMRDEIFVRNLCMELDIPLKVVDFDTTRYSKEKGISIEMAAREQRYAAFEEERIRTGAECIAVAHHRDDSAETVLMNLIRGTGIKGLHGIRPKNGYIIRPLLTISRKDITDYLEARNIGYVTDSTNLKSDFTRNKIRLEIIPLMQQINPAVIENIAATAENISKAENIYRKSISHSIDNIKKGNRIYIDKLKKEEEPATILHEILSPMGFNSSQTDDIYNSIETEGCKLFGNRNYEVIKDRNTFIINEKRKTDDILIELPISGTTTLPGGKIEIKTDVFNSNIPKLRNIATLDADTLHMPLIVRKTKQGDRFKPFGMKGSKLVSDYLTDKKVNIIQKREQLVITDSNDSIVWLVGERPAAPFCVSKKTKKAIIIEWKPTNEL